MLDEKELILNVNNLCVNYSTPQYQIEAVKNVNFNVYKGEILGIVGESGCGKTTIAMSILQLIQPPGKIISGEIFLDKTNIINLNQEELRKYRWNKMSLIPQGAMNSLNPVIKIKEQIIEIFKTHNKSNKKINFDNEISALFEKVGLPKSTINLFPHELSGGMKQRVCIAKAIALNPTLIIADEPTSALDVVVQRIIAQTLKRIQKDMNVSMIMIGHDMGLMAQMVDRIAVMKSGVLLEISKTKDFFYNPKDPYSRTLIDSIPSFKKISTGKSESRSFKNNHKKNIFEIKEPDSLLLQLVNVEKYYPIQSSIFKKNKEFCAVKDFNLILEKYPAKITTIAGESGSGKTTIANIILGNIISTKGKVYFDEKNIYKLNKKEKKDFRKNVQAIFQDPYSVYNPFYRVKHIFDLVINNFNLAKNTNYKKDLIEESLKVVGLTGDEVLEKYPHQLSGGQRQRMMVARAFLLKPKLIVADEPVSMVDASLRSMIIDLMIKLKEEHNISFLYITHDLSTAYQIGDNINIMLKGEIVESGKTVDVINNPTHPYVQLLVDSIPSPNPDHKWKKEIDFNQEKYLIM